MSNNAAVTKFDAKAVRVAIKSGMTRDEFCSKHQVSAEELADSLTLIFKRDSDEVKDVLQKFAANGKRKRKQHKKAVEEPENVEAEREPESSNPASEQAELVMPKDIDGLKKLETEMSQALIALESQHKDLSSEHKDRIEELRAVNRELDTLRNKLDQQAKLFHEIAEKANYFAEAMAKNTAERRKREEELAKVRARIDDLSKIDVAVCADGTIALLDEELDVSLDETGWEERYKAMRCDSKYDELKGTEIKILARVLTIKANSSLDLVFVFDNSDLETAYELEFVGEDE